MLRVFEKFEDWCGRGRRSTIDLEAKYGEEMYQDVSMIIVQAEAIFLFAVASAGLTSSRSNFYGIPRGSFYGVERHFQADIRTWNIFNFTNELILTISIFDTFLIVILLDFSFSLFVTFCTGEIAKKEKRKRGN